MEIKNALIGFFYLFLHNSTGENKNSAISGKINYVKCF